jgi:hypothetical protein
LSHGRSGGQFRFFAGELSYHRGHRFGERPAARPQDRSRQYFNETEVFAYASHDL